MRGELPPQGPCPDSDRYACTSARQGGMQVVRPLRQGTLYMQNKEEYVLQAVHACKYPRPDSDRQPCTAVGPEAGAHPFRVPEILVY